MGEGWKTQKEKAILECMKDKSTKRNQDPKMCMQNCIHIFFMRKFICSMYLEAYLCFIIKLNIKCD